MEVRSYINVRSLKTFQSKLSVTTRHPQQFRGPQALASPRCLLMTLSLWRPDPNAEDNHKSRKTGHFEILQQDRRVRKDKSELFIPCSLCTEPVASLSAASLGTRGRRRGRAWVVREYQIHSNECTLDMWPAGQRVWWRMVTRSAHPDNVSCLVTWYQMSPGPHWHCGTHQNINWGKRCGEFWLDLLLSG